MSTGNTPITSYYIERNCTGCAYAATGWFALSQGSASTSLTVNLNANEQQGMTYDTDYVVNVYAVNQCGIGYYPSSLGLKTKTAPSAPLAANTPVKTLVTAAKIIVSWQALGTSEDLTGGYSITGY